MPEKWHVYTWFSHNLEAKDCGTEALVRVRLFYTFARPVARFSERGLPSTLIIVRRQNWHVFLHRCFSLSSPTIINFIADFCVFVYLAGIRSWDTNLIDCNLDQELKLFVSRHSARFSADVKGKLEYVSNSFILNKMDDGRYMQIIHFSKVKCNNEKY